jgi:hypothetical protein
MNKGTIAATATGSGQDHRSTMTTDSRSVVINIVAEMATP